MLGRGYREFTQHFPQPGWVEHDPEEILRVSLEAMREALAAARRAAGGHRHHQPARDRGAVGPPHPRARWLRRSSGRTGAPRDRCRELRETRRRALLRERTGLVADPYFSATKLEWLLRDRGAPPPRRARRAGGRHGRELAGGPAHRRARARHRSHQRLAHAALRPPPRATGTRSCSRCSACRASCCRDIVPLRRAWWPRPTRLTWA